MDSFRKAYGALKDSTMVGLAKVNSDYKVRNGRKKMIYKYGFSFLVNGFHFLKLFGCVR